MKVNNNLYAQCNQISAIVTLMSVLCMLEIELFTIIVCVFHVRHTVNNHIGPELHACMQITIVSHSQVLKFQFWSWACLRGSMLSSFSVFWWCFSALSLLWLSSVSVTGDDIAVRLVDSYSIL